jgi:O-acetylhomoserine (thiol)-lyase
MAAHVFSFVSEELEVSNSIETTCVQGGYQPGNGEPRQVPIIQSTTFKYDTSEYMGKLFDLEAAGYFYTRLQNPTNDNVAAKICELEGGSAAMLTSSGQAANFYAIFNIASCGDHIVASSALYGGTFNLFAATMKRMGIEFTFIDPMCSDSELEEAFKPETKAVFGETVANPALSVLDIERFARAAHEHGVPLIIDNTFPTPVNCRPFEWGADIVTHSTTKYMDGHGAAVGGCIVDSGNFDWDAHSDKFPGLTTPDESYHGVTYTERFGLGGAFITKATAQLMRDFGSIQSPQNAFLLNLGLESLHLRMQQHCKNGQAVAEFLKAHPSITWVRYPSLEGDTYYDLAQKYLPNGSCGVVSFGVAGGREGAEAFMKNLKMAQIATHVADARTCVLHPANATHRQMTDEQLEAAGISPDLIRFSCGIEGTADLIADIEQALAAI